MKAKHNMKVRMCLLENGLVQADLAEALCISKGTVSKWLSKRELTEEMQNTLISTIKKIAQKKENENEQ